MRLYELTSAAVDVQDLLDHEDLTDEQRAEGEAMLAQLLDELLPEKVAGYCGLIRSLKLEAEAYKAEEKRIADRRKAREGLADRLTRRLQDGLTAAKVRKLAAGTFTVALQSNPPSVAVLDEAVIPATFLVPQPPVLDRRALLEALKRGEPVPGAELHQGEHLRIR